MKVIIIIKKLTFKIHPHEGTKSDVILSMYYVQICSQQHDS